MLFCTSGPPYMVTDWVWNFMSLLERVHLQSYKTFIVYVCWRLLEHLYVQQGTLQTKTHTHTHTQEPHTPPTHTAVNTHTHTYRCRSFRHWRTQSRSSTHSGKFRGDYCRRRWIHRAEESPCTRQYLPTTRRHGGEWYVEVTPVTKYIYSSTVLRYIVEVSFYPTSYSTTLIWHL